jgi:transposase-like protein
VGLKGGRQLLEKALIVGAVEVRGKAAGRVRLQVVPDASGRSLMGFVKRTTAPGTTILTDGWPAYAPLADLGYRHRPRTQGTPERAAKLLPHIHRVFGNLKTWLGGTHHGVGHDHLQAYLDEFAFRFNRRRTPMAAFQTLLGLASGAHGPTTYDRLYRSESTRAAAVDPAYRDGREVHVQVQDGIDVDEVCRPSGNLVTRAACGCLIGRELAGRHGPE